jgi:hypothetical protein
MGEILEYWKKCFRKGKRIGTDKKEEHKEIIKEKLFGDKNDL